MIVPLRHRSCLSATLGVLLALPLVAAAGKAAGEPSAAATAYVNSLLRHMTTEEKIGQMTLFSSHWTTTGPTGDQRALEDQIRTGKCGSVFNARTVAYIRRLQDIAVSGTRMHIPLMFGYDVVHGYNTLFPIPLGEAASWNLKAMERSARIAAVEAAASGLNWTFAPMVDIARDPRWGRIAEGAGEDPWLGSEIARARVRGFQTGDSDRAATILACVKHFAAYGAVQAGRDYNTVDMSERTLREVYLPPYRAAVEAGAATAMSAFNDFNGIPATANRFLLQQILRNEWGFQGMIVTDYNAVHELIAHGVAGDDAAAATLALAAGVDLDMQSGAYLDQLPREVAAGRVSLVAIEVAARRVLEAKYRLGLFEDPYRYLDEEQEAKFKKPPEHLAAASEMARQSLVLLKNAGDLLPLKAGTKIAVIGPLGNNRSDLLGCWRAAGKSDEIETVFAAIESLNSGAEVTFCEGTGITSGDQSGFPPAIEAARKADVIVLVLGESADMCGEAASRADIGLPGTQRALVRAIKQAGKPLVTIILSGRPLVLEEESVLSDALVEAWFPGSAGGRPIADLLFGKYNPSGRLPVTFPRNLGQVPIYYSVKNTGRPVDPAKSSGDYKSGYLDSRNDPLFPFGFGLGYTSFEYSAPKLDRSVIRPGESLTVTVHVTNTGPREGVDVVQLYLHDLVATVSRPLLELKGFQRIELKSGEGREVSFKIGPEQLAFWRADMSWGAEPGGFRVFVGPNSRDLQSASFQLEER